MIGIPLGLLTANGIEWAFHRYIQHGIGKNKDSFWAYHWHEHHRQASKEDYYDRDYEGLNWGLNARTKEIALLWGAALAFVPLYPIAPFFVGTLHYCAFNYYRVHKKSHLDPEWAKQNLPWHYDHHMGPKADANWCVTKPWFDDLLGTREPYLGTPKEIEKSLRKAKKAAQ